MAQYYTKINTLYKRYGVDESERNHPLKGCIKEGHFTEPEVEALRELEWECTEKIDGTNMSVCLSKNEEGEYDMSVRGKTDKANIPCHLRTKMLEIFNKDELLAYFSKDGIPPTDDIEIFGEGYGYKIQRGGNYIPNDVDFILFDVKIGRFWLKRDALEHIASDLGLKIVPLIGYMTIEEAVEYVRKGFKSKIAQNKDYNAEGLVCKCPFGLLKRDGTRLITKIKTCDFEEVRKKNALC